MSDTPIMDAVDAKCDELGVMDAICYAVYEGQKLEIKLAEMERLASVRLSYIKLIEAQNDAANERIKRLEENLMDMKNKHAALVADVALYEDRGERIQHLEDIINRAHLAFFSDSSDRKVSIAMHRILDEEVRKESP
jgi:hypothetical protein